MSSSAPRWTDRSRPSGSAGNGAADRVVHALAQLIRERAAHEGSSLNTPVALWPEPMNMTVVIEDRVMREEAAK